MSTTLNLKPEKFYKLIAISNNRATFGPRYSTKSSATPDLLI